MVERRIVKNEEYILNKKELYIVYEVIKEHMYNCLCVTDEVDNLYDSIRDLKLFDV